MKTIRTILTILAVALSVARSASSRTEKQWVQPATLSSGSFSNLTDQPQEKVIGLLHAPGGQRVRVVIAATLGSASQVRFVSLRDGQSQTLDSAQLAMWSNMSALFNGDTVRLELVLAPGDRDVSVHVKEVLAFSSYPDGNAVAEPSNGIHEPETLCGPDDRVASNDNRVGRLTGGCTGWLISNGGVLTAGHCATVAGNILEVNIPPSQPNGTTVASAVQDQFPVLAGTITMVSGVVGNDWGVFQIGPNNLGQFAHRLHGFFRMTRELPIVGAVTRVTGCGTDNTPTGSTGGYNAQNATLQTSTGSFFGETGSGGGISLQYFVDTEPGNSGSPIIWEGNGFTIGIHTAGGCTDGGGSNVGTSFELDALENAIAAVPGPNCRYLDVIKVPGGAEDGTVFQPHDTLGEAVNAVPVGGRLSVVAGIYHAAGTTITKAMTISAPVGAATFGN